MTLQLLPVISPFCFQFHTSTALILSSRNFVDESSDTCPPQFPLAHDRSLLPLHQHPFLEQQTTVHLFFSLSTKGSISSFYEQSLPLPRALIGNLNHLPFIFLLILFFLSLLTLWNPDFPFLCSSGLALWSKDIHLVNLIGIHGYSTLMCRELPLHCSPQPH